MTTPRIEEMVEEFWNLQFEGYGKPLREVHYELFDTEWRDVVNGYLEKALTQAHQAGIEEAVETYQEATDWIDGVVRQVAFDSETGKIWQHWLDEGKRILLALDDTIKALQDNK